MHAIYFLFLSGCVTALGQVPVRSAAEPRLPTKAQLTYDLALTLKMLGDEQFLVGNTTDASKAYERARMELKRLADLPGESARPDLDLLNSEVEYRSLLLSRNMDFWGGNTTRHGVNPITFYTRLRDDVGKLKEVGAEIRKEIDAAAKVNDRITDWRALEQKVATKADVAKLEEFKQENVADYHARRVEALKDRLNQIAERRQYWAAKADEAVKKLQRLEDAGNNMILGAVSEMTGLPINLSTLGKGSLQDQLVNTGMGMLADPNSGLGEAIHGVSKQAGRLAELYQQANEVKKKIDDGVATAKQVENVLRKPTLDSLLKVGSLVYEKLPPEAKSGLLDVVAQQKPLVALVELAREPGKIRTATLQYLSTQAGFEQRIQGMLSDAIDAKAADLKKWYVEIAQKAAGLQLDVDGQRALMEAMVRACPAEVLKAMPTEGVEALKLLTRKNTNEELTTYLTTEGLKQLPQVSFDNQHLKISGTKVDIAIPDLASKLNPGDNADLLRPEEIQRKAEQLKQLAKALFGELGKQAQAAELLLTQLPLNGIEAEIAKVLPRDGAALPELRGPVFQAILEKIPGAGTKAEAMQQLASMNLGGMVASSAMARPGGTPVSTSQDFSKTAAFLASQPGKDPNDAQKAMLKAAITGALTTAFPAAGVALKLIDFASNMFAMDQEIKAVDEARVEIGHLIAEELHLHDVVEESRLNLALAEIDQRIARAIAKGATAQSRSYRAGMSFQAENWKTAEAAAHLEAQLFFFWVEVLRQDYDFLDRSLAMWLGKDRGTRGEIARLVQEDPQNARLALDSEIHLFGWLNPDLASQREDITALTTYWEKMLALCTTVCRNNGCTKDSDHPGQIDWTESRKLTELVSKATWRDFKAWQQNPRGRPFTLWFLIHPGLKLISPLQKNVRLVDVRLGARDGNGRAETLHQFSLVHSGVGYIPSGDHFIRDVLAPEHAESLNPPGRFDRETLMRRWVPDGGSLSRFEGYSMFSPWELTLQPADSNRALKDLEVAFAYEYISDTPSIPVTEVTELLQTLQGTLVVLPGQDLQMLGSTPEILQKVSRWSRKDASADQIPPINYAIAPKGIER